MTTLLLLSGCGESGEELNALRARLNEAETLSVTAKVSARRGDGQDNYTLRMERDAAGSVIDVIEPELIRGFRASVLPDGGLEFAGTLLYLGTLGGTDKSPLAALPLIVDAAREGHMDAAWSENGLRAYSLIVDDNLSVELRLGGEGLPTSASIIEGGEMLLYCEILDFTTG